MDYQSPIHNLPTENLSTIFMFCCEENELSNPSNQPAVINLSAVCGHWRGIVLATPAFWSKLDIVAESPSLNNVFIPYLTKMTQLFMERSKSAPLTWSLTCYDNGPFLPILNHLVENCERWSDVSLSVDNILLRDPVLLPVSGQLPMLKRLELKGDSHILRKWNIFAVAPILSVVDCTPMNACDTDLPWSQIRDLTLHASFSPESLRILSQCPNLEHLELECIGGQETLPDGNMVTLTLHQVHSLSILPEKWGEDTLGFVLEFLTLPNLSSIVLGRSSSWKWSNWGERQEQIQQFLLRSWCTITHLRLEVPELDDQQAVGFLTMLPSLETLHLHDKEGEYQQRRRNPRVVTPLFLQQLIVKDDYSSDSSRFLPRLSNLILVIHSDGLDAECLHNAVASRSNPKTDVCSLRSVAITVVGDVDSACLSALEKLAAPGRSITISHIRSKT